MSELRQNTLEDATTESSFLTTINENAGETVVSLQREVELEDGEIVTVEGITPDKMKAVLNNGVEPEAVTFKTPGEYYNEEVKGVVRAYNESVSNEDAEPEEVTLESIEVNTPPDKVEYLAGESFDPTGMIIIANYSNGTTEEIDNYSYEPSEALTEADTEVTITYEGVSATQEITVSEE